MELDKIRESRVRKHKRHDKSDRGSDYHRGLEVFAAIAASAIRHSIRYDRYVQFRHPRQTEHD